MLDLEQHGGRDWAGWTLHEGLIYAPEWRQGLHTGEIRAIPYLHASVSAKDRTIREARASCAEIETLRDAAERRAHYYRDLVSREARLGLMLSRIT